jgi:hypothetical protein
MTIRRIGTNAIKALINMGHQMIRRMSPKMMATTPMMIPSTFPTVITPFEMYFNFKNLANDGAEVKAYFIICHLRIKSAPFFMDLKFKSALLILGLLSYP